MQLPTFARDQWVSLIQGEALGIQYGLMSAMPSNLSYISYQVDVVSFIHLITVSNFRLVLNSSGKERGVIYHPPEMPNAIKKTHRDL